VENSTLCSDADFLIVFCQFGKNGSTFSRGARFTRRSFFLHDRLDLVEVPGAEVVRVDAHIQRKRQRLMRKIAVRMSVEMPCALSMVRPHSHRIMAEYDPLLGYIDFRENIRGCEQIRELSGDSVVIAFNEVDGAADQPLAIGHNFLCTAQAEVAKEIENIVWLTIDGGNAVRGLTVSGEASARRDQSL
jgi:hypothetical protein